MKREEIGDFWLKSSYPTVVMIITAYVFKQNYGLSANLPCCVID